MPLFSVVKLVKNFRSHNSILKFPNEKFYKNELQPCGDSNTINAMIGSPQLVTKDFPILFHGVSGKDDREASSPSFFNIDEATLVKTYVEGLRSDRRFRVRDQDIGVITPYHAQCLKIRAVLRPIADEVKVGSVEEFQGQVCSNTHISVAAAYTPYYHLGTQNYHHLDRPKQPRVRGV